MIHLHRNVVLFLAVIAAGMAPVAAADTGTDSTDAVTYRDHVWPILKRHCLGCHSNTNAKGGLKLDTAADLRKGGESGPLFVAGKPDESLLMEMITGDEPSMPPKGAPLAAAKVATLRQWIAAGAKVDTTDPEPVLRVVIPAKYTFAPPIAAVALSGDGKWAAVACRSEVVLVDVEGEAAPRRLPTESDLVSHVEYSPDGKLLAAAGGSPARYGEVRFFDPDTGQLAASRRTGFDTFFRGNFAPDGKAIALGAADGGVYIVPVDPKADVRHLDLHSDWVFDVAYTPDGKMLVSGGRDNATKVASVEAGKLLRSVDSTTQSINAVAATDLFAFSAGQTRALTGYDFKVALENVQVTGSGNGARPISRRAQYAKGMEAQPGEVLDIAISGDRSVIAVVGRYGEARIYKTADRGRTALVQGLPAPIYAVALNHDGSRLAVGSKSGQLQVYQLPDGKLLKSTVPVPLASPAAVSATK